MLSHQELVIALDSINAPESPILFELILSVTPSTSQSVFFNISAIFSTQSDVIKTSNNSINTHLGNHPVSLIASISILTPSSQNSEFDKSNSTPSRNHPVFLIMSASSTIHSTPRVVLSFSCTHSRNHHVSEIASSTILAPSSPNPHPQMLRQDHLGSPQDFLIRRAIDSPESEVRLLPSNTKETPSRNHHVSINASIMGVSDSLVNLFIARFNVDPFGSHHVLLSMFASSCDDFLLM